MTDLNQKQKELLAMCEEADHLAKAWVDVTGRLQSEMLDLLLLGEPGFNLVEKIQNRFARIIAGMYATAATGSGLFPPRAD